MHLKPLNKADRRKENNKPIILMQWKVNKQELTF